MAWSLPAHSIRAAVAQIWLQFWLDWRAKEADWITESKIDDCGDAGWQAHVARDRSFSGSDSAVLTAGCDLWQGMIGAMYLAMGPQNMLGVVICFVGNMLMALMGCCCCKCAGIGKVWAVTSTIGAVISLIGFISLANLYLALQNYLDAMNNHPKVDKEYSTGEVTGADKVDGDMTEQEKAMLAFVTYIMFTTGATLVTRIASCEPAASKPEIHRVDPEKALTGIFSQTSGPTCEFWVNPFYLSAASSYRNVL